MGRRISYLVSRMFVAAICLIHTASSASDGQVVHTLPMGIPGYGGSAEIQTGAGSVSMAKLELPVAPLPPGTVGQTYSRPSHPVPADEHPRTGMLAVRDDGSIPFLSVQNMGGIKMKSGIWLFESRRPLDPGACQIVRVEARQTAADVEPYATRFVRLIPGRIVYLDF
ncbi:MAG: hypothetical protein U0936_19665 [Planctomycetaceae bacterium]